MPVHRSDLNRREFLLAGAASPAAVPGAARSVSISADPADPVAGSAPVRWAARELERALEESRVVVSTGPAGPADFSVILAGPSAPGARGLLPACPEALALSPAKIAGRPALLVFGSDPRGLVYATLDLADRVRHSGDPVAALTFPRPVAERPANTIRSVTRCFVSNVEDKPWFHDRAMWPEYLSMLAAQRFNRFSLAFGIGYDFLAEVRDTYLHFAYPFLVAPPGYDVRARGLSDAERDRNLEMLRFIGNEAEARGLDFQLALWTHGYQFPDNPQVNYFIDGLGPDNHAAYCRDALYTLLEACPAIRGVTFRIHGESGVAEGAYDFWRTVFSGIVRTGRKIEIDMHAKGMDYAMIDVALATGMPVNVSPKYWAEHMGLPYHQAGIRDLEKPAPERQDRGFFALSGGSRKFLRYGYGDLLREDRRHGVLHRMWPGTQRVLLWGDPEMAAAYGRASSFCGSAGIELCEPLSFKGRKGSGLPGGRCGYADASLNPRWDWEKYLYTYRVWGRLLYNPDAGADTWRRPLGKQFGPAAADCEAALANASRILPLVTTVHGASGANNTYWPEMYTNMPTVDRGRPQPYGDTPAPKTFGASSPFDPVLFARVDDFAGELLKGDLTARYSPLTVARWLDDFAGAAAGHRAGAESAGAAGTQFRRLSADVAIQAGLGRFFAGKLRSAVLYSIHQRTGERAPLEAAIKIYRAARAAWAEAAEGARDVYRSDITFGYARHMRGHWLDRLPAIDEDIAAMEARLAEAKPEVSEAVSRAIREVLAPPRRVSIPCHHTPAPHFRPGAPLPIEITLGKPATARLHYRHVNQAEEFRVVEMQASGKRRRAVIPAEYTKSPFPLQYYFELREGPAAWVLYPALEPPGWRQPYFVVRTNGRPG